MNKTVRIYRYAGKILSADAVNLLLMTVFTIFLARAQGGDKLLGIYSFSFVVATLIRSIMEAGYDLAVPIKTAEDKSNVQNIINSAQETKNFLWLVTLIPGLIYGYFEAFGTWYYIMLLVWNLFASASMTFKAALRGLGGASIISSIEIKNNIMLYFFLFVLVLINGPFSAVFLAYIIFELIKNIQYIRSMNEEYNLTLNSSEIYKFSFRRSIVEEIKGQWSYIAINFGSVLQFRSALQLIGFLGIPAEGGVFSAAFRFVTAMRIIPGALYNILVPEYVSSISANESLGFKKHLLISAGIGIAGFLLLYFLAEPLIMWTYGFGSAIVILKILSVMFLTITVNHTIEAYLLAKGMPNYVSFYLFLTSAIGFVSAAILYKTAGLGGAAFGQIVSELSLLGFYLFWALKLGKENKQISEIFTQIKQ